MMNWLLKNCFKTCLVSVAILMNINSLFSQSTIKVEGLIVNESGKPIRNAHIISSTSKQSAVSDAKGVFEILVSKSESYQLSISHIQYETTYREVRQPLTQPLVIVLLLKTNYLDGIEVQDDKINYSGDLNITRIEPKSALNLPSATGDFNKVLATLPGVSSNNELSSAYSVRGGNYDENLVYVNGIKVYRPQIISAGRQEGLSFINPDLVRNVQFSAGGWRARYGDRLSSVLNVEYKEPTSLEGRINVSALGGSVYAGGRSDDQKSTFTIGARHKNSRYLLNTLSVQGEYFPKFTDIQSFVSRRFSHKTKVSLLGSAAFNSYETIPALQQTDFGTSTEMLRFTVGFDGRERLLYRTYQLAGVIQHSFSDDFISNLTLSTVNSVERENFDIESGYRLCDLVGGSGIDQFNNCISQRALGTRFESGRNRLDANLLSVSQQNEVYINNDLIEFGASWDYESLDDRLREFSFTDSADFANIEEVINNQVDITSHKIAGFAQYTFINGDSTHIINAGIRLNYWTFSEELLTSPRVQYVHIFKRKNTNTLRLATGLYSQHPFYRELRDRDGNIQENVTAQKSFHVVLGWDRYFNMWGRPFKMTIDSYYKYLWDVNLYDIENVRIRYFANNDGIAKAHGFDFRLNGEFVEGAESWFSFGYLNTQEALNENTSFNRRPTDQRLNLGISYQDYLSIDPTLRVNLNFLYGSGLPFSPPENDDLRSAFIGDDYFRVDIGFSKYIEIDRNFPFIPKDLTIGLEVLNLLATENAISYTWIQDLNQTQYAIPNTLSNRFLNLRIIANF